MIKKDNYAMLHPDKETIIAQCTPCGSGAVALIRLSGQHAISITTNISNLASGKKLSEQTSHTIHFGWVIDKNNHKIDQVLFLLMHNPKTFTGQDTVEITCHNNQFIIDNIINRAIECGARLAQNGEFTKRAFLNNKIDLIQAEAINELIHSQTQTALKSSLAQLKGSLSCWTNKIEKDLLKTLALSESSFEFIEDEQIEFGSQIKEIIKNNIKRINTLKKTFNNQKQIREGIKIAIIGSVNAGKSSLFNTLLKEKRAIVTNIAGTTRDSIQAIIIRNGNNISLIDTAGLRQTDDKIEKEGIQRSFDQAQKSDIILLVIDGSRDLTKQEITIYQELLNKYHKKIILVKNKCDIKQKNNTLDIFKNISNNNKNTPEAPKTIIQVSSLENKNIYRLEQKIDAKIKTLFSQIESPFLLNKRQHNLLSGLENKLLELLPIITSDPDYEIVSYHLKDAISYLTEFTGKTASEKSIDIIFKEFCIGK